jgi:hypothetical protein
MTDTATYDNKPPDRWPQTAQLILLAFHDDPDFASLAGQELLARLDIPAIPLVHDDGRRRLIVRGVPVSEAHPVPPRAA